MTQFAQDVDALAAERPQDATGEAARLHRFFELHWRYGLEEFPEWAVEVGEAGPGTTWTDWSLDAVHRRRSELDVPLHFLKAVDPERLTGEDRLSHELAFREGKLAVDGRRFPDHLLPVNQLDGPLQGVPMSLGSMPALTGDDLELIVERLRRVPRLLGQTKDLLVEGLAQGITPPCIVLHDLPRQLEQLMTTDPDRSPLLEPLRSQFPGVAHTDVEVRLAEGAAVVRSDIVPALAALGAYLVDTYIPACRPTTALADVPDGHDWYAHRVRVVTSTDLEPEAIHEIGVGEVERIGGEMVALVKSMGTTETPSQLTSRLRAEGNHRFATADELVAGYQALCKRIDPELVRIVGTLPRLPYGVSPMPAHLEQSAPAAYYQPGSPVAGRPGQFLVNTYLLADRVTWEMGALALHEAVPGHHLQIARAQELEHLPKFRQYALATAYVEGWALYCEGLGDELGIYDDLGRLGRLTFEMWRAVRLVVDTGLHRFGWSRQQAIDYFSTHSGQADHEVAVEVDRYIAWPGQALAYKLGELTIRKLRQQAATVLGARFDLRSFHDEILGHGPLPLDVLKRQVSAWMAA